MQISELKDKGKVFQSQLLLQLENVEHFSSMKETKEPEQNVWLPRQVHGTEIVIFSKEDNSPLPPFRSIEADAVITDRVGLWIGVRTADCVPVLMCDNRQKVVAAIHAGWRGSVKHIVQKTVQTMKQHFGCQSDDLWAMIGPSISPDVYEVGEEVAQEFISAGRADCIIRQTKPHIDLWQSNVMDLLDEDIPLDHIDCSPLCTFLHSDLLYSARKEGIGTGRNVSAISLKVSRRV